MGIKVPVTISYSDKGVKQAIKGIGRLDKSFKKMKLSHKLTYAALSSAAVAYGKKSVNAALEESKAIAVLNNSLKNLGLAFAATGVTTYIDNLQRATGVSEDQLRPAFGKLIRATSDLGKAQQLLALTLDISASTGFTVEQVSKSLSKAYLGQNTALGRLGVGLTKTELATLSFEQIQKRLTVLFKGGAAAAVDTYAGSVARLQIAAKEASETIGFALVDGVKRLGDDKGIEGAASAMEKFASEIGFAITGMAVLIDTISNSTFGKILATGMKYSGIGSAITLLADLGKATVASENTGTNRQSPRATEAAAAVAATKAEKARLKAIADQKKLLALKKQSAAADKLKAIFDIDLIQLQAAKQYKLTEEQLARVNALIAIKTNGNADDLKALEVLDAAQKAAAEAEIKRQNDIKDNNKKNAAEILADNKSKAKEYADFVNAFTYSGGLFQGTPLADKAGNAFPAPVAPGDQFDYSMNANLNTNTSLNTPDLIDAMAPRSAAAAAAPSVTVNLQGGINIGSTSEFYESVWRAIENSNTYGNSLYRAGTGP